MINKEKILDWAVWAMIAIVIVLFLLKVFGNSPTFDQLATGLATGFLLKLYSKVDRVDRTLVKLNTEFKNHKH